LQTWKGAAKALEHTAARARGLRAALGDIVWTVGPTRDRLADLIRGMRETAQTMLEAENRSVQFVAPLETEMEDLELPPDMRRRLFPFFRD
jgi:hypothetical protein